MGSPSHMRPSSTWRVAMARRSPDEPHRSATPLELFFDLVFVVAIARASGSLEHEIIAGHVGGGVANYLAVFFAIWWAWMNFTWFASAYDNDDVPYRAAGRRNPRRPRHIQGGPRERRAATR